MNYEYKKNSVDSRVILANNLVVRAPLLVQMVRYLSFLQSHTVSHLSDHVLLKQSCFVGLFGLVVVLQQSIEPQLLLRGQLVDKLRLHDDLLQQLLPADFSVVIMIVLVRLNFHIQLLLSCFVERLVRVQVDVMSNSNVRHTARSLSRLLSNISSYDFSHLSLLVSLLFRHYLLHQHQ